MMMVVSEILILCIQNNHFLDNKNDLVDTKNDLHNLGNFGYKK